MGVIASLLLAAADTSEIFELLTGENFFSRRHELIFDAIRSVFDHQGSVDTILVQERLEQDGTLEEAGGLEYLLELSDAVRTSVNATKYAQIVRDRSILRRLISTCTELVQGAYEGVESATRYLEAAERRIFEIAEGRGEQGTVELKDAIKSTFDRLDQLSRGPTGLMTGFSDLDRMTTGLQPSELAIVAGRPSMGKTTFTMNVARHAAVQLRRPVLVFSLEVDATQMALNLLVGAAKVNAQALRQFQLSDRDWRRLTTAADQLSDAPIFIDDSPNITAMTVRAKARRLKAKHDISMIVIDYLQLLEMGTGRYDSRQQEITDISRSLKALARELKVPVVTISQLSRAVESRESHRPRMSDLRESGAIEQDADLIMLLYREEYYKPDNEDAKGKAEVIIAKQRNGPVGSVHLAFINESLRFENLAQFQEEF